MAFGVRELRQDDAFAGRSGYDGSLCDCPDCNPVPEPVCEHCEDALATDEWGLDPVCAQCYADLQANAEAEALEAAMEVGS